MVAIVAMPNLLVYTSNSLTEPLRRYLTRLFQSLRKYPSVLQDEERWV